MAFENLASHEAADQVQAFFDHNIVPGSERSAKQAIESIRQKADWLQRDFPDLHKLLVG